MEIKKEQYINISTCRANFGQLKAFRTHLALRARTILEAHFSLLPRIHFPTLKLIYLSDKLLWLQETELNSANLGKRDCIWNTWRNSQMKDLAWKGQTPGKLWECRSSTVRTSSSGYQQWEWTSTSGFLQFCSGLKFQTESIQWPCFSQPSLFIKSGSFHSQPLYTVPNGQILATHNF